MLRPDDTPLCAEVDPEIFFPEPSHNQTDHAQMFKNSVLALSLCARCDLQHRCLEFALSDFDTVNWGIYGNTLPNERLQLTGKTRINNNHNSTLEHIRKLATEQGIPAPTLGGKPLNVLGKTA